MIYAIYYVMTAANLALAVTAQIYRSQRNDLAAAWVYAHPEDFPDPLEIDA